MRSPPVRYVLAERCYVPVSNKEDSIAAARNSRSRVFVTLANLSALVVVVVGQYLLIFVASGGGVFFFFFIVAVGWGVAAMFPRGSLFSFLSR